MTLSPKTAAELDAAGPAAIDGAGGRYFPYARRNGKGQIDIRFTSGEEISLKFWIAEEYLPARTPTAPSSNTSISTPVLPPPLPPPISPTPPRQKAIFEVDEPADSSANTSSHTIVQVLYAHPWLFAIIGILTLLSLFAEVMYAQSGLPRNGSFIIGSFGAVIYYLGIALLLRFYIFKKPLSAIVSFVTILPMFFFWFMLVVAMAPQTTSYKPSFLMVLCIRAAYLIIKFRTKDIPLGNNE